MASDDLRDLPVYSLTAFSTKARFALLTPASRWRVVVEQTEGIANDIVLETVVRLRQAGETSTARISDLLQLPFDLVQHLQARAISERLHVTPAGDVQVRATRVAWVYRDLVTGDLWPKPAEELPAIAMRYSARRRGSFEHGTAGRPIRVDCLVLESDLHRPVAPTGLELARFTRASDDPNRRTAVVSEGERCLVVSPLVATVSGTVVEVAETIPNLGLTQAVARLSATHGWVASWLAEMPMSIRSSAPGAATAPLDTAVAALREAIADWRERRHVESDAIVLGRIELAIRRYCDQCWYAAGLDPHGPGSTAPGEEGLSEDMGLSAHQVRVLVSGGALSLESSVRRLIAEPRFRTDLGLPALLTIASIAADWAVRARHGNAAAPVDELALKTLALCENLLNAPEGLDGRQVG